MSRLLSVILALSVTACATSTSSSSSSSYRQIYSLANSSLCVTIDGTNTPVVNTCTAPDP
jgi:hypothetical protein